MAALVRLALLAVLAGFVATFPALHGEERRVPVPRFLAGELGAQQPGAPLVREPVRGVRTRLDERSFGFERAGASVALAPERGGGAWTAHAGGATRATPFGSETIVFRGEDGLEQYLTVARRQGPRTWRWQLEAKTLEPRARDDGSIEFFRGGASAALQLEPVAVLDASGGDVTPDGLRWSLARRGATWWLELDLDDRALPLPYTIDPAITQTGSSSANVQGGTSIALTRPGNVGDLLVAQVATRSTGAITAPAGWTLLSARSQTNVQQATYWKVATGSESLTWSWATSVHAAGGVVAYANPHPTSPIDVTTNTSGSSTTATATGGTAARAAEQVVALYAAAGNPTLAQSAGQGVAQVYANGTAGGSPTTRIQVLAAAGNQAAAGAISSKTATVSASANWVSHLVSIRQAPDDGDGVLAAGTTSVGSGSPGNTITFTYTAGAQGVADGAVAVDVPAGWSAPSTTANTDGYTTSSAGSVAVSGQRITVAALTLDPGATVTITYGSTAGGGAGATSSSATGAVSWNALGRGTATGTLTALAASPSIDQLAADGSGTMTASVAHAPVSSTGNTIAFTYTAASGGMAAGSVRLTVPAGWSAPSTTGAAAGFTTASTGSVGVVGQVITVTGVTLAGGATMTITYGATGSGGPGASASSTPGAATWQAAQDASGADSITNLAVSPSVTLLAADGSGTLTTSTTATANGSGGNTLTFTYTAAAGGIADGAVRVTVPAGWSAPSTTAAEAGFTSASTGTVGVAGQAITVTGVTLAGGATMTVVYGDTGSGGPGATAPTTAGAATWQAAARSSAAGTITSLAASPSVNVHAPDGSGTLGATPGSAVAGSSGNTITLTYTAAAGGMADGALRVTAPAGWSAPSTTATAAGFTTASTGTVGVSGQQITVTGVTLAAGTTLTITYGATGSGGPGATAATAAGSQSWASDQRATSSGTLSGLAASPSITVTHASPADFLVEAAAGGAIGAQTAGASFAVRVTARDAYGNTVTSFDGAGSTVDVTSTGSIGAGAGTTAAFSNGVLASHSVTLTAAGSHTITATRTSGGAQSGTSGAFTVAPAAAATLEVDAPATATAGSPFSVTVTARDAYGNVAAGYTGTVAFSGGGTGAQLPADVAFTGGDAGVKTFGAVELRQAGTRTLTVTDTVTGTITGSDDLTVEPAAASLTASTLDAAPGSIVADGASASTVTLQLRDAFGNDLPAGDGASYAFATDLGSVGSATDNGDGTYEGTLTSSTTVGTATVSATRDGSPFADAASVTFTPGAAVTLDVVAPASAIAGSPFSVTVTARDAYGNVAAGYTGTVAFSGGGTGAQLPADVAFTGGDAGVKTFGAVELRQAGTRTLTVTDTLTGTITGNDTLTVDPAAGATLDLDAPTNAIAGSPFSVTVTARDAYGNVAAGYTGTVAFSGGGTGAQLPADHTFTGGDAGVKTFGTVELRQAGARTLTVTDTLTGTITGDDTLTVDPGAGAAITLGESGSTAAGDAHTLTATVADAYGNTVTADSSTVVTFAKTGGAGTVDGLGPASASAGVATKTVTNRLAGQIDLEATAPGLAGGSASYTIAPGPVSAAAGDSTVVAAPTDVAADGTESATITVTLRDASGNPVAGKTVTLDQGGGSSTISGGGATNAAGVVTFSVTSTTEEQVTYTAADTTDSLTLVETATVDFVAGDAVPPTNTIALGSATGAYLSGTTIWYRPAAAGSFTLSSAVADGGAGPGSATYPLVTRAGWTHAAETVSAGPPYVSGPFTWTGAAAGDFDLVVTAADAWSPPNTSATTLDVVEDSTAPAATAQCDSGACIAGWYAASPVSVTLGASDGGSGVAQIKYTTDGSDPSPLNGSVYLSAVDLAAEGTTEVRYRAYDRVGNESAVVSQLVRIDTVDPGTTIESSPAAATSDTTPSFAFESDEGAATFEYRLDAGAWTAATSPLTLGPLAEDTYTFEVRAVDAAGNVDPTPASFVFTVDTSAADTTIDAAPPAASNDTTPTFAFTASDAGPSFEYRLDAGAWTAATSPLTLGPLPEGTHELEVRAMDAAGNVDPTPATHEWTVDTTAPDTSFLATPSDPSATSTPAFGLDATEPGSTFECKLDAGAFAACATPWSPPALGEGSHTVGVRATDAAGNTDATAATFMWTVDTVAPTGTVTAPANGAAVSGAIALTHDAADGGSGLATAGFERSPAGAGSWSAQATPWDTTTVGDGDYDLRVRALDAAGNVLESAPITVTVDNTAPTLSISAPDVNLASPDPETVTATAGDDGTGVASVEFEQCSAANDASCAVDTWTPLGVDTTPPYSAAWPLPADGGRLLRVRATDGAGRQATVTRLVTVDRTAPTTSVTAPSAGANLSGAVAVAATAADATPGAIQGVDFQLTTAGGSFTDPAFASDATSPYAGTLDTTGYADGLYDLRALTSDVAGNSAASPVVTVRIDNTAPTGSVTAPLDGADLRATVALASDSADGGSGVATVAFERSPAGAGTWAATPASWDTTGVADGLYDLRVVTTDAAGNSFASAPVTVRVDNTAPTGAVTAPVAGADVRGTITLASDSADAGSGVAAVQFQRSPAGAGAWTNQAAAWDTTSAADGLHDVRVVTTDAAGNAFTSAAVTIRVDNTAPTGSVTAPADGAELGVAPVALASDSADAGSGVATVVFERSPAGAGTWTATPSTWDTASGAHAVAEGLYDVRVTTSDNAGNTFTSAAVTVLVDHSAPVTSATLAPGSPSNAPVTVGFGADDGAGAGVSVTSFRVDGGAWQFGTSAVVAAPGDHSNDGSHVVDFYSTDDVGNVETPKSVTVVIDTTAPSGAGGDPGAYLRGLAGLTYTTASADVVSVQFEFSPAGMGAWASAGALDLAAPWAADWATTAVADGAYDLRAVVTDAVGNVAHELLPGLPKTVDNTTPFASVSAPSASAVVSGTVGVAASATDVTSAVASVRFEVKPSGAAAFSVFGTQTAPVVGSTYQQALATGSYADGPADLQVVVTDVAGNETTSAVRTVTIDNDAPTVTLDDPGAHVGASAALSASASGDTTSVAFRYRPVGDSGAGTLIGTDAAAPFGLTWSTAPAAEQQWELLAVATDAGGNSGTSAARVVLVDRTQPAGGLTAPATGATVGGPAVPLAAGASDPGGSGVVSVAFEVKELGSAVFEPVATDTTAPFAVDWDATAAPDGATELRAVITDAAGNTRTTAVVPVTVDSTGPSVTLTDPGPLLTGTVALAATTGGGAVRVAFGVGPAGAGTWTVVADDSSAPYGAPLDTSAFADGLYDLRAIGYDVLGNPSAPFVLEDVRFDNTAPALVSAAPADGSVSAAANQIVLTASEPVTAPGALLDGAAAPAPIVSGNELTFATGALADGLHVLEGELEDAGGTRVPFRVAVTIESAVGGDRPPVELSARRDAASTLTAPGGLAAVTVPPAAWPAPPSASDFLVLRVDLAPPPPAAWGGLSPGTQLAEVTARWALAGTAVTDFAAPIDVVLPNPSGAPVVPATSADGSTWRALGLLDGATLPAARADGWYRDGAGRIHVLTRHLTWFALLRDDEAPTPPRHLAAVVADDGLTLRWIPGSDASGRLGDVLLLVDGVENRAFGPTEYEAKLGAFEPGDTRRFTLVQLDAAGNRSLESHALRAVPPVAGLGLEAARSTLAAAGFAVGTVTEASVSGVPAGAVVSPRALALAAEGAAIDLVVARAAGDPHARLAFSVTTAKSLRLTKAMRIPARVQVSRPARLSATLIGSKGRRLHGWSRDVEAGATVLRLPVPARAVRPGTYTLRWVARSGPETVSRTTKVRLVRALPVGRAKRTRLEVVVAGELPPKRVLQPALPRGSKVVPAAGAEHAFALVASPRHAVGVALVDADAYGIELVRDLRAVFPELKLIALSGRPATRRLALRAGAVRALPRSASVQTVATSVVAAGR